MSYEEDPTFKQQLEAAKALAKEYSVKITDDELIYLVKANRARRWTMEELKSYFDGGLYRCIRCDQHFVGGVFDGDADAEQ
jgi:hypothetical protein